MKKKLILFILILLIPAFAWASSRIVFMSPGTSGASDVTYTQYIVPGSGIVQDCSLDNFQPIIPGSGIYNQQ